MIDEVSLASDLFGKKRLEVLQKKPDVAIVTGVAIEDSEDGLVKVRVNGTFTLPEDEQAPSVDGNVLTLPTSPAVKEGDNLIVTMHGGQAKRPYVSDVIGGGDRQQADINRSLTAYTDDSTYYLLSATVPATPTDSTWEAAGWSTTEPVVSQEDTRTLYVSRRVELVDGTVTWSAPAKVVTSASIEVAKNAILATVSETYATKDEALNTASGSGRSITMTDAAGLPLRDLTVYGESVQEGTPTPDAPVPIQTVVRSNGTIGIGVTHDGTETVTSIDLQGHSLASLPDGTQDVLHVENGRAWIDAATAITTTATTDGITATVGVDAMSTTGDLSDGATVIYAKAQDPIDLGEVSLPVVQDGDTVRIIAEVQPVFDTSWWRDTDIVGRTTDVQSEAATAARNAQNTANTANEKADTLNESVSTLTLRADGITASVKSMQQDYGGTIQSVNSYMTFGTDGLEIGKEGSPMKSYFNESSLSFKANGQEVMKLDGVSSTVSADRWKVGGWLFYKADGGKTLVLDYFG